MGFHRQQSIKLGSTSKNTTRARLSLASGSAISARAGFWNSNPHPKNPCFALLGNIFKTFLSRSILETYGLKSWVSEPEPRFLPQKTGHLEENRPADPNYFQDAFWLFLTTRHLSQTFPTTSIHFLIHFLTACSAHRWKDKPKPPLVISSREDATISHERKRRGSALR